MTFSKVPFQLLRIALRLVFFFSLRKTGFICSKTDAVLVKLHEVTLLHFLDLESLTFMNHPPGPPCAGLLLNLLPSWGVVRHAVHRKTADHVYRVNLSDIEGKEMIQTLTCAFFPEGVPQQGLQPVRTGLQNIMGFVPKNESSQ